MIIDLNSDIGEGFGVWQLGDDDALLDIITSASVACGFHGGDPSIMRRVCTQAVERGVVIGAQVGYRDLAGFGRRSIDVEPDELGNDVLYQIGALDAFARVAGDRVRYVKPHGALYNRIVHDADQAEAVVDAVHRYDPTLPVLGLPRSEWLRQARSAGLTTVPEAFADRAYTPDATLVPRREDGAVLHDTDAIVERAVGIATRRTVAAADGNLVSLTARSLCVHGDTPGAVQIARRIRDGLRDAGVDLVAFVAR